MSCSDDFSPNFFDHLLAQRIQPNGGGCLGLALAATFREGHTAISLEKNEVYEGAMCAKIREELDRGVYDKTQIVVDYPYVALPYAYALEKRLAAQLIRLRSQAPTIPLIPVTGALTAEQASAIQIASKSVLCAITGGPGTGKTYTAGMLVRGLVGPVRLGLTAPTGRAVQALDASIRRAIGQNSPLIIEAKTIHSLIRDQEQTLLPYHMLLIDECSMIDSFLLAELFKRIHSGTRVLMLGDPGQLAAVGPGQPFFDIIESAAVSHVSLNICQRAEASAIIELAGLVRDGSSLDLTEWLKTRTGQETAVQWLPCSTPEEEGYVEQQIRRLVFEPWRNSSGSLQDLRKAIVVTPKKWGRWGTEAINSRGPKSAYSPLVVSKNDHHLGIMNGDLGVKDGQLVHFEQGTIPYVLCPHTEPAYAITVHKSQGSEFDTVVVFVPKQTAIDQRLLYTAVTRARKRLVLVGSLHDIALGLTRKGQRVSLLPKFISEIARAQQGAVG